MQNSIKVAVLGSTGYVGLELINLLSRHSKVIIEFLGSDTYPGENIIKFDKRITNFMNEEEIKKLALEIQNV